MTGQYRMEGDGYFDQQIRGVLSINSKKGGCFQHPPFTRCARRAHVLKLWFLFQSQLQS